MTSWTDTRIKLLAMLVGTGYSAGEIAAKLGGVTRNAVIGKIHRLGMTFSKDQSVPPPPPAPPRRPAKVAVAMPPTPPVVEPMPPGDRVTLFDLGPESCRWPINDGHPEYLFCGRTKIDGAPYCLEHARKATPTRWRT